MKLRLKQIKNRMYACPTTGQAFQPLEADLRGDILWLACTCCIPDKFQGAGAKDWHANPQHIRWCSKCERYYPATDDYWYRSNPYCKPCARAYRKERQHAATTDRA